MASVDRDPSAAVSVEKLKGIVASIADLDPSQRARLCSAWHDYFTAMDSETPEIRKARLTREVENLLAKSRQNLQVREREIAQADSVIPEGLTEGLEVAAIDEDLMWLPRATQELLLGMAAEYDAISGTQDERLAVFYAKLEKAEQ